MNPQDGNRDEGGDEAAARGAEEALPVFAGATVSQDLQVDQLLEVVEPEVEAEIRRRITPKLLSENLTWWLDQASRFSSFAQTGCQLCDGILAYENACVGAIEERSRAALQTCAAIEPFLRVVLAVQGGRDCERSSIWNGLGTLEVPIDAFGLQNLDEALSETFSLKRVAIVVRLARNARGHGAPRIKRRHLDRIHGSAVALLFLIVSDRSVIKVRESAQVYEGASPGSEATPSKAWSDSLEELYPLDLEQYIEPDLQRDEGEADGDGPGYGRALNLVARHHCIIIVGAAGSGKTSLAIYLASQLPKLPHSPKRVRAVLFVPLKLYRTDLLATIQQQWSAQFEGEQYMRSGLAIMLDGRDEMGDEAREGFWDEIKKIRLTHPYWLVMVSTRPEYAGDNPLEWPTYRIALLSDGAVCRFISKKLPYAQASQLQGLVLDSSLQYLRNAFFLNLTCQYFAKSNALAHSKGELIRACVEAAISREVARSEQGDLKSVQRRLAALAAEITRASGQERPSGPMSSIVPHELSIAEHAGITSSSDGRIGFSHAWMRQYFAARAVADGCLTLDLTPTFRGIA